MRGVGGRIAYALGFVIGLAGAAVVLVLLSAITWAVVRAVWL